VRHKLLALSQPGCGHRECGHQLPSEAKLKEAAHRPIFASPRGVGDGDAIETAKHLIRSHLTEFPVTDVLHH
jgi:hypothetical protein